MLQPAELIAIGDRNGASARSMIGREDGLSRLGHASGKIPGRPASKGKLSRWKQRNLAASATASFGWRSEMNFPDRLIRAFGKTIRALSSLLQHACQQRGQGDTTTGSSPAPHRTAAAYYGAIHERG
jgi:hypothetical protein